MVVLLSTDNEILYEIRVKTNCPNSYSNYASLPHYPLANYHIVSCPNILSCIVLCGSTTIFCIDYIAIFAIRFVTSFAVLCLMFYRSDFNVITKK